jgi:hypothetical protein
MTQTYHANGKLLLTGEYFILDGAVGLALPTKFGQSLSVEASAEKGIFWKSIDHENKVWLEVQFSESLEIISTSNNGIAETLQNILLKSQISNLKSQITTILDFPNDWGLGSSSTLISLLAQYANVDPYELLAKTFGGSGYDIACATAKVQSLTNSRLTTHDSRLQSTSNHHFPIISTLFISTKSKIRAKASNIIKTSQ